MRYLLPSSLWLAIAAAGCKPAPVSIHFERPSDSECRDEPDSSHYCLPSTSASITTFDPNDDTRPDLAILARSSQVAVLTAISEPAFTNSQFWTGVIPAQASDRLLACRTTGDAFEDLVHNGHERLLEARIWTAPQAASGKWVEVRMKSIPMLGPTCVDFDSDGALDVVGLLRPDAVAIRSGGAVGFEDPLEIPVDLPSGENAPALVLFADVDDDGRLDIVGADNAASTIFVMRGTSGGAFGESAVHSVGTGETSALAVAEIDNDEMVDVISSHGDENTAVLSLIAIHVEPEFRLEQVHEVDLPIAPTKLQNGDLGADGSIDVLLSRLPAEQIFVYSVDDDELVELDLVRVAVDYAVVDLNGDSRSDLAVVRSDPAVLEIFWNRGDGELSNGTPP